MHDVDTVATLIDHALDPGHLAADFSKPGTNIFLRALVDHGATLLIPVGGTCRTHASPYVCVEKGLILRSAGDHSQSCEAYAKPKFHAGK